MNVASWIQKTASSGGRAAIRSLELVLWMLVAAALSGSIGPYDPPLMKLLALGVAGGILLGTVARRREDRYRAGPLALGGVLLALWMILTILPAHLLIGLAALPLAVVGIDFLEKGIGVDRVPRAGLERALLLFNLHFLAWMTVPAAWHWIGAANRALSHGVNDALVRANCTLGPSMAGYWAWSAATAFIIGETWVTRRWRTGVVTGIFATVAWMGFMVLLSREWFNAQEALGFSRSQALGFLLVTVPSILLCLLGNGASVPRPRPEPRPVWRVGALLALIGAFSALLCRVPDSEASGGHRVLVYGKGYLDWKVPSFGEYGPFSGGMFGLMPRYLEADGFGLETFKDDLITSAALKDHDVLVLINLGKEEGKTWAPGEVDTIWEFVRNGGGLLILGDHTNVFGLQDCFNELLGRAGIRFEFDAAYPCREGWRDCIVSRPHPVTADLTTDRGFGIAIGASLTVSSPAFPLVIGRYSFSDSGVKENVLGSYLGNYRYDPGEPLGDMVLVAGAHYGRGKVLVFGDTSTFQNGAWSSSLRPFAHNVLTWLCRPNRWGGGGGLAGVLWLLLAVACVVLHGIAGGPAVSMGTPLAMAGGLLAGWCWLSGCTRAAPLSGNIALFDYSHGPRVNTDAASATAFGGFLTNLDRNGYLTLLVDRFDRDQIRKSKLYSTIAPAVAYSPREVSFLLEYMEKGGLVVAAAGYPDRQGILPLLTALDLDVANFPLGPIPPAHGSRQDETDPRFVDAYPVVLRPMTGEAHPEAALQKTRALYKYGDYVPAVFRKVGTGGLIFFADSRFFTNMNLEGMEFGTKLGNILFIREILSQIKKSE